MRTGKAREVVSGLIASAPVTPHSGETNQYFVRRFNLDYGTDVANVVADMPVNMPSCVHDQGYSDLNFIFQRE